MKARHILKLCLALLLCCPLLLKAQSTQTNYEYWIDDNKDEAVSGTVNGEDINLSIDVGSLTTGMHFYNIRAYETVGSKKKWGTTYCYLFTIPRSANGVPNNLSRYEYWLDNDYEHRVTKSADDDESEVLLSLNLNTLLPGVHFYNFRAQNVDGGWGVTQRYLFSIPSPQQETGSKLITGYSYAFNDGAVTNVVFDTPVDEYQLIKAFNVPQAQPPMVIDDDCSFVFDDEDNIATLSSNINMSFALFFKDQSGAMNSPVTSDFLVEDVRTQAIQSIAIPGTAAIVSHINGGFSVVRFDVASKTKLKMMTDGNSALRLYSPYSQLLGSYEASSMTEGVTREFEEGSYYAVIFGNPTDVTFSLSPADPNVLKPKIAFDMDKNVVTMTCTTPEASIYYTIDGSTPTAESTLYSAPFAIDKNVTIKAIAIWAGPFVSPIATMAIDIFEVDDVTFSQVGNTLTLATTTEGATIHYNVDGGEWLTYSNPLVMEGSHTVQAYAEKTGYTTSNTTSFQFYYVRPVVATPLITHEGNVVTISCTTIGATIYYTTDGTEPTVESSLYTLPLTVDSNCTIKAIAFKDGYDGSQVATFEVDWIKICGYAVLDSETGTLTFKYGQIPKGDNVYETENTGTKGPWNRYIIKTVIFESSYSAARPTTTEGWFYSCTLLTSISGIEYLNTSEVTNMHNMFNGCSNLESLDVSHFNTSKVTNMNGMFRECKKLQTLDVSHFDTSNVTNMSYFFYNCNALEALDVSNFNTENVEYMGFVFAGCNKLTELNLTNFNTEKAILTNGMFRDCKNLTELDLSSFQTSTVSEMSSMFLRCEKLKTIYVGDGWTTENVTYNSNIMFEDCTSLIGGQGTAYDSNYTDITYAHIDGGSSNPGYFTASGSEPYTPEPCGYAILDKSTGTLTFKYGPMPNGDNVWETENTNFTLLYRTWDTNSLRAVVFDASYAEARPTSTAHWFYGAKSLETITGIEYLNTSNVTNMDAMFWNCSSLTSLDVTHFDTKNVTDMTCMFMNCSNLVNLDVSYFDTKNVEQFLNTFNGCSRLTSLDVSHFNTSKVKSMAGIFSNCSNLTNIDVTNFDTSNATSIGGMFSHCTALSNVDVSNFETGNVTSMSNLFYGCSSLTNIDVSHFDTRNVTFMSDMFRDCVNLTSLDLSNFNTENVLSMSYMFSGCNNLTELDVSSFDTKNVTSMSNMFADCRILPHLDISNFNTSKVEYMSGMFRGCSSLTDIDVSNFDTHNVISLGGPKLSENSYLSGMFQGCENLTSLNLCSFNTAKVESMSLMFYDCKKLEKVFVSEEWTTENVTNADFMFANCTALVGEKGTTYNASHVDKTYARIDNAPSAPGYFTASGSEPYTPEPCGYAILDKSTGTLTFKYGPMPNGDNVWETEHTQYGEDNPAPWDCPNLKKVIFDPSYSVVRPTSTADWFADADKLTNISGIEYLNTSEVTDMSAMFFFCNSLTSLDVSGFDTRNVTNMAGLFAGCAKLTSLDLSNFNTEKVTSMTSMFIFSNLSCIDVSSFNTSNVKSMGHMFAGCLYISNIDVSNFVTENVTDMSGMFASCRKLTSLDLANFNTSNVTSMAGMFLNCPELTEVNVSSFNTSNVKNMRFMFARCEKLTSLDLSNFDTHNVTRMDSLFYGSDEGSFQISYVEDDVRYIPFKPSTTSNSQLKTIYVSDLWDTSNVTSSIGMFQGCISLVGSKGTTYNVNYVDKTYARIDGGMSAPGYFTRMLLMGDVNDDGLIDMVDVVAMVNYILGTPSESFVTMAADLNSDGEIDVFDATQLVSMILAKNGNPAESRRAAASEDATQERALLSAVGNSVSLNIDQPERFTAFQFEMDVPEGCELENVRLANRSSRHGLRFAKIGENKYKVVGFSLGNELLHSQNGKLVEMQLSDLPDDHVAIGNVLFVTPDEEKTYFCGGPLSVVTGVDVFATDKEEVIYDMSGRKQSSRGSLKKGVYIINGKKGVIK